MGMDVWSTGGWGYGNGVMKYWRMGLWGTGEWGYEVMGLWGT